MIKKIGIFDSGIGGLSVLKELLQAMPGQEFYYISDQSFAPYGNLTTDEILERSKVLTQTLLEESVDLIVVACNTATAHSIDLLRKEFDIPFVGIEPYINYVNHDYNGENVGLICTPQTLNSERYQELKKPLRF